MRHIFINTILGLQIVVGKMVKGGSMDPHSCLVMLYCYCAAKESDPDWTPFLSSAFIWYSIFGFHGSKCRSMSVCALTGIKCSVSQPLQIWRWETEKLTSSRQSGSARSHLTRVKSCRCARAIVSPPASENFTPAQSYAYNQYILIFMPGRTRMTSFFDKVRTLCS